MKPRRVANSRMSTSTILGLHEGHVVPRPVFCDVHDIGKVARSTRSSCERKPNKRLTRSSTLVKRCRSRRYSRPREEQTRPLSALRRCSCRRQAMAASASRAARRGASVPRAHRRAAINATFVCARFTHQVQGVRHLQPGVFLLQVLLRGAQQMDQLIDADARAARDEDRDACRPLPQVGRPAPPAHHDTTGRSWPLKTDVPRPGAAVLGRREIPVPAGRDLPPSTRTSLQLHWGRVLKGRSGSLSSTMTSSRAWSACGSSRTTCIPRHRLATSLLQRGQRVVVLDPADASGARAARLPPAPALSTLASSPCRRRPAETAASSTSSPLQA